MWQDQSHCSTNLLEPSRLDPTLFTGRRLNWLDQKNILMPVYKLTKLNVYANE